MEAVMKNTIAMLTLIFLLSACGPSPVGGTTVTCRSLLDSLSALTGGLEVPGYFRTINPVKTGGEFDVMQYFTILDHLSPQPGYVLDYVYHYDELGGFPVLYVRTVDTPPYKSEAELTASDGLTNYMDFIQTDDTPDGYFQYVLLSLTANRFYLFWHANYSDSQVVCDKADVNRIVASLNGDFGYRISLASRIRAAFIKDIEPSIVVNEDSVEVSFVTFTRWGGFFRQSFTISRSFPHAILDEQEQNLVPYDCGVLF
jgi:hypothetical protein